MLKKPQKITNVYKKMFKKNCLQIAVEGASIIKMHVTIVSDTSSSFCCLFLYNYKVIVFHKNSSDRFCCFLWEVSQIILCSVSWI